MPITRGVQFLGLFCGVLLPFIGCNELHEHFTKDEVLEIFNTDHNSVPGYELVEIWHTLDKRDTGGEMILMSYGREIRLYLQPSEGFLVGENTTVWLSRGENGTIHYTKLADFILRDVAKLYMDSRYMASIAAMHTGSDIILGGTIAGRSLRSLPSRFTRHVMKKRSDLFPDYGFPKFADPKKNYTRAPHHIMLKDSMMSDDNIVGHVNRNFVVETNNTRHIRGAPTIVYPELLIITDYAVTPLSSNHPRFLLFLAYILGFWNGADLRFRTITNPEVRLQIVGIIVATNREALPWMTKHRKDDGTVRAEMAVHESFDTILDTGLHYSDFDAIITQTNQPLCGQNPSTQKCDRKVAGACSDTGTYCNSDNNRTISKLIINDIRRFEGLPAAVHELGHALGAVHDGEDSARDCRSSDHYVMATELVVHANNLIWSECTRRRLSQILRTSKACVRNSERKQNPGRRLRPPLPGQLFTVREMCHMLGRPGVCDVDEGHCDFVRCQIFNDGPTTSCQQESLRLLDGSECGVDKYCLNGECANMYEFENLTELQVP